MTRVTMMAMGAAALLAALCFGLASPAAAQSGGSFEIHVATCPVAYTGMDYLNDCAPTAKVGVHVDDADAQTDANGAASFPGVAAGDHTVTLDVPGDFATFLTTCSTPGYVEPLALTNPNTNQIGVTLTNGEAITCSFYVIPDNAKGDETTLPATGVGPASSTGNAWLPLALVAGTAGLAGLALRRRALS
jgi:hypothetical protein